jgi:pimeloyl-ACP methyl ester carboxylesterase
MLELFKNITAPTLCVHSSDLQLDRWWKGSYTFEQYQQRIKEIPQLSQIQLQDCAHMLHHDQPQALAQVIEAFLK